MHTLLILSFVFEQNWEEGEGLCTAYNQLDYGKLLHPIFTPSV